MRWWLFSLVVAAALGCGAASKSPTRPPSAGEAAAPMSATTEKAMPGTEGKSKPVPPGTAAQGRKIIHTATVELVVENFDPVQAQVEAVVRQFDGYVARSNVSGLPGRPRSGQWTVRVPVARYEGFLAAVRELGEVQNVTSDSKDVTEEYYDVEAHVRNKKQEETRLLKLLAEATGKLEEILAVEKELSRVRGEIEQLEGRLRVLTDQTTLTTVTLRITEVKEYVPQEAATYATRARRAFEGSISTLVSTAQGLSIVVIALVPWLVVLGLPVVLIVLLVRWTRRG